MKPDETIAKILNERFSKDSVISLATTDGERPYVRNVDAYYENGSFYIITYAGSNKMLQLEANPNAAVSGDWFTASGIGESLGSFCNAENAEIAEKLKKAFAGWINNGHSDLSSPDTVILCIRLTEGVLFSNGTRYEIEF